MLLFISLNAQGYVEMFLYVELTNRLDFREQIQNFRMLEIIMSLKL